MNNYPTTRQSNYPSNLKIVFLGTPRLAQIVLENLASSDFKPQLIITGQDKPSGRSLALSTNLVKQVGLKQHIEVDYKLKRIDEDFDLAILAAFGQIIPKEILEKPKYGFVNVHPSLLPKYRGPSPIQSAILAGEKKTGVSIIKLDNEVDHGPILAQRQIEIEKEDTHKILIEKTGFIGANLLIATLPDYLSGKLKPFEQNHKGATLTEKITKTGGKIDLDTPPSKEKLDRMIRAFYPWPTVWTKVDGKIIKFLPKGMVQMESKKPMTLEEFFNGYQNLKPKLKKIIQLQ